jgi:hypothetical protein
MNKWKALAQADEKDPMLSDLLKNLELVLKGEKEARDFLKKHGAYLEKLEPCKTSLNPLNKSEFEHVLL